MCKDVRSVRALVFEFSSQSNVLLYLRCATDRHFISCNLSKSNARINILEKQHSNTTLEHRYNIAIRESLLSGRSIKKSADVDEIGPDELAEITPAMKVLGAMPEENEGETSTADSASAQNAQNSNEEEGEGENEGAFIELERRSRSKKRAQKKTKVVKKTENEKKEDVVSKSPDASDKSLDLFIVRASLRQEAQLKVDECEASCRDSRDEILHKNIYTDTPSASTARDLFASLISWSQIMCEGIYRASMINGDTNAVQDSLSGSIADADPNDAAKGHCRMMDNEAEIELCLSFLSTFLELMSKKADLDDWTQVSKHSFIFYAEKLMAFNPEFAYVVFERGVRARGVRARSARITIISHVSLTLSFIFLCSECCIHSSSIINTHTHTHTHTHTQVPQRESRHYESIRQGSTRHHTR